MFFSLVNLAWLLAAVCFIVGLKFLSRPRTAALGNAISALGMAVAVGAAVVRAESPVYIVIGITIGAALGAVLAYTVKMTAMPQMVALLNGLGGGACVLVAGGGLLARPGGNFTWDVLLATGAAGLIGAVTFWGSLVVCGKLAEYDWLEISFPPQARHFISGGLAAMALLLVFLMLLLLPAPEGAVEFWGRVWLVVLYVLILLFGSALGIALATPLASAHLPAVISLLVSCSGLAASATGFILGNNVLIIAGALVGASGILLSQLMCRAMNRSLQDVLFGGTASEPATPTGDELTSAVRHTTAEEAALLLEGAQRVVIVPGYGLAMAQAQHAVRDLAALLEKRGARVEFAIHPLAGRMPGHMSILLAEAEIDYEKLKELDEINPTLETVDVALVVGACDVVNPALHSDAASALAGMPIVEVNKCRAAIVIKRSLAPGHSGVANGLFTAPNTLLLLGDGQRNVVDILQALKEGESGK